MHCLFLYYVTFKLIHLRLQRWDDTLVLSIDFFNLIINYFGCFVVGSSQHLDMEDLHNLINHLLPLAICTFLLLFSQLLHLLLCLTPHFLYGWSEVEVNSIFFMCRCGQFNVIVDESCDIAHYRLAPIHYTLLLCLIFHLLHHLNALLQLFTKIGDCSLMCIILIFHLSIKC